MKRILSLLIAIPLTSNIFGQKHYNRILKSLTDSFNYSESGFESKFPVRKDDTISFGTNYYENIFKISTEMDSVSVRFNPWLKPYKQTTSLKIRSPNATQVVYVSFNEVNCWFSNAYLQKAMNWVQYEIPETYELANVVYALTKSSDSNSYRTLKGTSYYRDVLNYFKKYKNHLSIKRLEFADDAEGSRNYYNFRENSYCFTVEEEKIVSNKQYYVVWGELKDNLFAEYLTLIRDFYRKSNFHQFYQDHRLYYDTLLKREEELMPVRKMWHWLEKNFDQRIQSYKVVFSPLINGSHSTQVFYWIPKPKKFFAEAIMFISGTRVTDKGTHLTETQKEGIASGIAFTEIDHNYCNLVAMKYGVMIDSALRDRNKWVAKGGDIELYPTAMSVFNEYITHALYLLYSYDNFQKEDFEFIRTVRENLMVQHRRYIKFKEFNNQLLKLYKAKQPQEKVEDLFPKIIDWCNSQ